MRFSSFSDKVQIRLLQSPEKSHNIFMSKQCLTLGYFPIRGKAQVCRLLCEYLQIDYTDRLYSISQWDQHKRQKLKNFALKDLPYLNEGQFRVTGSVPICLYLVDRFSNGELLGNSLKDRAVVDMYLWTIDSMNSVININCQKGKSQSQLKKLKEVQWRNVVAPKLQKYEQKASNESEWFLSYLTIVDFSIYELVRYMEMIFGDKILEFPKLRKIAKNIENLPKIKQYEQSSRAIREMCPTSLLKQKKNTNNQQFSKSE